MIKKSILSLMISIAFCFGLSAQQIATNGSMPIEALIQNTLGKSGCVEISNISSSVNGKIDNIISFGSFTKEKSSFPFKEGLILSTGRISSAGNATNSNDLSDGTVRWGKDPDLETALGISQTMNATSVEFDFISAGNQIAFNYILASEEYIGVNPCLYSDGFAFLIKEAGTSNPFRNIALVPGTSTPVNTETIRPKIVGHCAAANEQFFEGYNLGDTNYNGQTTVLTASSNIKPNVAYRIKLIIADQKDWRFDSAVFIEADSFNTKVDLGPDLVTCAKTAMLNGSIGNDSEANYEWLRNGVLIPGAKGPTINVDQSGNYMVRVSVPLKYKTCVLEDTVVVTLDVQQNLATIPDFILCDGSSNDGREQFDLDSIKNQILQNLPPSNYKISYHNTSADAINGSNALATKVISGLSPTTIYIRIEDTLNGCLTFTSVRLIVNPLPQFTPPQPVIVCDADGVYDGKTEIDLEQIRTEVSTNPEYVVSFHYDLPTAQTGDFPITLPYQNTDSKEKIYIRIYNSLTGCFNTTSVDIEVITPPIVNVERPFISSCAPGAGGFEVFDLQSIIADILAGITAQAENFYESYEDAENGVNPIANPSNYQNKVQNLQHIFLKVIDPDSGCFSIVPIELHTDISLTGFSSADFIVCDDLSEDGVADFDLEEVAGSIVNDYDGFGVEFFESQADANANTNLIDSSIPYTVSSSPHTLYAKVSNDDCDNYVAINLIVNPPLVLPTLAPIFYCDTDQDGTVDVVLETLAEHVSAGMPNVRVHYYESLQDAYDDNFINQPFITVANSREIFVRVSDTLTSCYDIAPLEINISTPPIVQDYNFNPVCDADLDGLTIIDLTAALPSVVTTTSGVNISYHPDYNAALQGENDIENPETYETGTRSVGVRIEDQTNGCISIATLNIIVNMPPQLQSISDFKNCEAAGTQTSNFYFYEKDEEILDGQTDKQVLYFANQTDALNRTNILPKYDSYAAMGGTIYVRVEALTDSLCFETATFDLEVGSLPPYNKPTDIFVCDNILDTGIATINLDEKISEIRKNHSNLDIVLYASLTDAEQKSNPIKNTANYRNEANPQSIYARIEDGSYCHAITTFSINVVQLPASITPTTLTQCDIDSNGHRIFDLTEVEFEILPARRDNIVTSYHISLADAEDNTGIIANPKAYTNTAPTQTVYIRVNNTVSNCYVNLPITLKVNMPPVINDFATFGICENPDKSFDLSVINSIITSEKNIRITYHSSKNDAINGIRLPTKYSYQSNNDQLYVRLENTSTGCVSYYNFRLVVNPLPVAHQPTDFVQCENGFDKKSLFDLSSKSAEVLGSQSASIFEVSYYGSLKDATTGRSPLPKAYKAGNNEVIYARVFNTTTGCFSTTQFSTLVNLRPRVAIENQTLCIDKLPLTVDASTGDATDRYVWSNGQTTSQIEITAIGTYSVTVTSIFNCQTTSEFEVISSESATIDATETIDFSDPNNITITISGSGNYRYILDNGLPQDSPVFENVTPGYHRITIIDLNGCAETVKEVVVVDAPKFFTPNADGFFDTWHITGIETLPGSSVNIYDRYGKHIITLTANSKGWNGFYNGRLLPSTDYWFSGTIKKNENTFKIQGHFALKL